MWKGKTRGGVSGYLFFIYMIRYCGVKTAYGFLSLIVLYFIPFAPKATKSIWQYARRILRRNRIQSMGLLLNNYYRLGQILIDKVAIGNGMIDKYHFKFNHYQEFLNVLDGDQGVIMIGAHVGNWEIGTPFFNDYSKKMNGRTRQTLWRAVQMLTQKLCCQTIHDCPKVVPLHYESE